MSTGRDKVLRALRRRLDRRSQELQNQMENADLLDQATIGGMINGIEDVASLLPWFDSVTIENELNEGKTGAGSDN